MKFNPSKDYDGLLRQARALNTCYESSQKVAEHYRLNSSEMVPKLKAQLESERQMNAILTEENQRLEAEIRVLSRS